jgi:hypothetical protein
MTLIPSAQWAEEGGKGPLSYYPFIGVQEKSMRDVQIDPFR